ncbi:hypothetical protein [Nocardiopsis sp. CNR-923]|uniref:hypothetical protein n=1 Tax=Nocardiopsis sp. CNR-923 TaxID=1904965 RepID=UPI00373FE2E4
MVVAGDEHGRDRQVGQSAGGEGQRLQGGRVEVVGVVDAEYDRRRSEARRRRSRTAV